MILKNIGNFTAENTEGAEKAISVKTVFPRPFDLGQGTLWPSAFSAVQ
jgi:hypothetical protein